MATVCVVVDFDALVDFLALDFSDDQADGASLPASLARIAAFMSSVICSFKPMAFLSEN
jgi:hypothetical protein